MHPVTCNVLHVLHAFLDFVDRARLHDRGSGLYLLIIGFIEDDDLLIGDFQREAIVLAELQQEREVGLLRLLCPIQCRILFAVIDKREPCAGCHVVCDGLQLRFFPRACTIDAAKLVAFWDGRRLEFDFPRRRAALYGVNSEEPRHHDLQAVREVFPVQRDIGHIKRRPAVWEPVRFPQAVSIFKPDGEVIRIA